MKTTDLERLRTLMYGEHHERFNEIMTLLSDPNLQTDDIPHSVCAEDITYALRIKGAKERPTSRTELLQLLCVGNDELIGVTLFGDYSEYYTTSCKRLKRYLYLSGAKSCGTWYDYQSYKRTPELIKLIGQFTEVIAND